MQLLVRKGFLQVIDDTDIADDKAVKGIFPDIIRFFLKGLYIMVVKIDIESCIKLLVSCSPAFFETVLEQAKDVEVLESQSFFGNQQAFR